jgi:hypothetical protein
MLSTAAHSSQPQDDAEALLQFSVVLQKYPAWAAEQRPASARQQLNIEWRLPLQQLKEEGTAYLAKVATAETSQTTGSESLQSPTHNWTGDQFGLLLRIVSVCGAKVPNANGDYLGLWVIMKDLPPGAVRRVQCKLGFVTASASNQQQAEGAAHPSLNSRRLVSLIFDNDGRRSQDHRPAGIVSYPTRVALNLGAARTWAAAEAKLRELGLVHSDGCLHLAACVTSVV